MLASRHSDSASTDGNLEVGSTAMRGRMSFGARFGILLGLNRERIPESAGGVPIEKIILASGTTEKNSFLLQLMGVIVLPIPTS
jgi:hypothetical protein